MPTRYKNTFCRICEPGCPLTAEIEEDGALPRLKRLSPYRDHPLSKGFACHKGINFTEIHHDPDRLDEPLKRNGSRWQAMQWDDVIEEIAGRIRAVTDHHGPDAVAGYIGNPIAFNTLGGEAVSRFFQAVGTTRVFNSGTQDCANKFAAAEAVFGTSTLHPIPDIGHSDFCLILGENPKVSHMSFISIFDPMAEFRKVIKRGGRVVFVNPRHIESASPRTGEVFQVRPDTDLYLLAALLTESRLAGLWQRDILEQHSMRVAELESFIAPFDAERVAGVVGVAAEEIRGLAMAFATAPSASVHMSTGVNMGRQGTLCYWLLQMLSLVTGNLDRRGGNLYAPGFYPAARAGRLDTGQVEWRDTPLGEIRHIRGALPGNLLADFIRQPDKPVRALLVIAGNPLLSIAGEERLREALEQLDLLVVIDLFRNTTAKHAHFVLPAADMLERADVNLCGLGMQYRPHVQYTDAVVPPAASRREEWWILGQLLQALGLDSPFDGVVPHEPFERVNAMLRYADLDIEALRRADHQYAPLPEVAPGRFYSEFLQTASRRIDCCPPLFDEALLRAAVIFDELSLEPPGTLKLITLRNNHMLNSWFHNAPYLKRVRHLDNPLHVAPADASRLELEDGQQVCVRSAWGSVKTAIAIDPSLRDGTVAMTHGWGHRGSPGLRVATKHPGCNVNRLMPQGPGIHDKLSNQAFMTGIPVTVSATDDERGLHRQNDTSAAHEDKTNSTMLTRRELHVLEHLAEGLSNDALGRRLHISVSTVRAHLRNIYSKLSAHSRTEAVAIARRLGLIS